MRFDLLFGVGDGVGEAFFCFGEAAAVGVGVGSFDECLRCLAEIGVIDSAKPPSTRRKYLEVEQQLVGFARDVGIDFDELDLVLWSMKTGEVLK